MLVPRDGRSGFQISDQPNVTQVANGLPSLQHSTKISAMMSWRSVSKKNPACQLVTWFGVI